MADPVEVAVKSQLDSIVKDLEKITEQARDVNQELEKAGDAVEDNLQNNTKRVETFLDNLRSMGGRVADQLRRDFRSLISLEAIKQSLNFTEQFKDSIKEAVTLNDHIRKFGPSFGLAKENFNKFHTDMMKGLGELGLASDVGARTMEGLVDTPVKGADALEEYAKTAGMLASMSGDKGAEGDIAKGIAKVLVARGQDPSNQESVGAVAEDLRRVFKETGMKPAATLAGMEQIFSGMSKDFRESISTRGLAQLAAAGQVAGPQSTKFLEDMFSKSPIARMALEAQGFKDVFTKDGLDIDKFRSAASEVTGRVGGDPRLGAQTLGLSGEAAEGFVRLYNNLDKVKNAQDAIANSTGTLTKSYRESLGLGEAFRANINRVKKVFAEPLSMVTGGMNDMLGKASESDLGAGATVLGGGALAALLAGFGLRGLGKGMGGGMAGTLLKGGAAEAITGKEVQPVYVVNASEIGGGLGGAAGGMAAGGMGAKLLKGGKMAGGAMMAGAGGYMLGSMLEPAITGQLNKSTTGKTSEGFEGNALERLFFKLDKLVGGETSTNFERNQKVIVELNQRQLKATKQPTRGSSF